MLRWTDCPVCKGVTDPSTVILACRSSRRAPVRCPTASGVSSSLVKMLRTWASIVLTLRESSWERVRVVAALGHQLEPRALPFGEDGQPITLPLVEARSSPPTATARGCWNCLRSQPAIST